VLSPPYIINTRRIIRIETLPYLHFYFSDKGIKPSISLEAFIGTLISHIDNGVDPGNEVDRRYPHIFTCADSDTDRCQVVQYCSKKASREGGQVERMDIQGSGGKVKTDKVKNKECKKRADFEWDSYAEGYRDHGNWNNGVGQKTERWDVDCNGCPESVLSKDCNCASSGISPSSKSKFHSLKLKRQTHWATTWTPP